MKHSILITPLNCAFTNALSDMSTFYEEEFNSASGRKILYKNEYESFFKMKSTTSTAYLEPTFYGLMNGDTIEVEFEACCLNGNTKIRTQQVDITPTWSVIERTANTTSDFIPSYFKQYKTTLVLRKLNNALGVVVNIRPTSESMVIIQNVKITIDTKNSKFGLTQNTVSYENESDIMACVNYYSQTKKKTAYNSLKTIVSNKDEISIVGNELKSIGTNTNSFKGLISMFPVYKGYGTLSICLESESTSGVFATTQGYNNTTATNLSQKSLTNTTLKKKIYYIRIDKPFDFIFSDVGSISSNKFTVKGVVFSMTHFNDVKKSEPNKLEDLNCI